MGYSRKLDYKIVPVSSLLQRVSTMSGQSKGFVGPFMLALFASFKRWLAYKSAISLVPLNLNTHLKSILNYSMSRGA